MNKARPHNDESADKRAAESSWRFCVASYCGAMGFLVGGCAVCRAATLFDFLFLLSESAPRPYSGDWMILVVAGAVFGGMVAASILVPLFVPVFYTVVQRIRERVKGVSFDKEAASATVKEQRADL